MLSEETLKDLYEFTKAWRDKFSDATTTTTAYFNVYKDAYIQVYEEREKLRDRLTSLKLDHSNW